MKEGTMSLSVIPSAADRNRERCAEGLRELTAMIQSGKVRAFAVAIVHSDLTVGHVFTASDCPSALVGSITLLQNTFVHHLMCPDHDDTGTQA